MWVFRVQISRSQLSFLFSSDIDKSTSSYVGVSIAVVIILSISTFVITRKKKGKSEGNPRRRMVIAESQEETCSEVASDETRIVSESMSINQNL